MPEATPLTRAEWKVMKIVWARRRAAARDVVLDASARHEWSPSTVKTLLKRLVDKGHLRATRVGNSFLYEPTQDALPSLQRAADLLFEHAIEGLTGPLLVHLVKKSRLSPAELAELRALVNVKEVTREGSSKDGRKGRGR